MIGSGKNRQQRKQKAQEKKSSGKEVYSSKHVRQQAALRAKRIAQLFTKQNQQNQQNQQKGKKGKQAKKGKKGGGNKEYRYDNYNYVINPLTGKKVNIYGKLGKHILKKYINILVGGNESAFKAALKGELSTKNPPPGMAAETDDLTLPSPRPPNNFIYQLRKLA